MISLSSSVRSPICRGKRNQRPILYHIGLDLCQLILHSISYRRDKQIVPLANGRSPSGIRKGSIPQLIRLER